MSAGTAYDFSSWSRFKPPSFLAPKLEDLKRRVLEVWYRYDRGQPYFIRTPEQNPEGDSLGYFAYWELLREGQLSFEFIDDDIGVLVLPPAGKWGGNKTGEDPLDDTWFVHSPDFRSVTWCGEYFTFTSTQAAAVRLLFDCSGRVCRRVRPRLVSHSCSNRSEATLTECATSSDRVATFIPRGKQWLSKGTGTTPTA